MTMLSNKTTLKLPQIHLNNHAKSITYGGLDGIITTFAVVAGSIGGKLGTTTIIILGFSNLLADRFSMAAGDYLSSTAETNNKAIDAFKNAIATFLSFNIFGLIPLLTCILLNRSIRFNSQVTLILASLIVSLTLAILGWIKASITGQDKKTEIIRTLLVGIIAAGVAYAIGQTLGHMI